MKSAPTYVNLAALPEQIGQTFGPTEPFHVDQAMVDQFAALTGDHQWVHVDVERATRELGGTIAHGYLTLSLVPRVMAALLKIDGVGHGLNYGADKVRFPAPCNVGSMLQGRLRIIDVERRGEGYMLRNELTLEGVGAPKPVCVVETLTLLFPGNGKLD
jgi:acyl dehydratase